jgi:hypothetical protein
MTRVSIRILTLAAVAGLPALAGVPLLSQQPSSTPQPTTGASPQANPPTQTNPEPGASEGSNPQAAPVPSTANSPEAANPQLRPVTGELENKLDTKDAKNGDSIVVKTTQVATIGNGVEIPQGSEIKGHIIDVAPKGQDGDNGRVTIQFDQAQLKNGQNLSIRSVIQSIAPPGTATETGATGGPSTTTPSVTGGGAGTAEATGAPGASTPGNASSSPGATPSEANPGAPPTGAPVPGTVVATKGNLAIKTTAIPGVLLIGDVNGRPFSNASGALLGAKQDVHLDNGTVMVVAIMTAPATIGAK